MQGLAEHDLIYGCRQNDRTIQNYLFRKYYGVFLKICLRYLNNHEDAEQVLNDSFYKIYTKIDTYRGPGSFEGWMKRIVVNTCLDELRKNTAQKFYEQREENASTDNSAIITDNIMHQIEFKEIMNIIRELPIALRTAFNMYIFEGYSHKEIAQTLKVKEGTSHWYVNRARELLKQKISSYNKIHNYE